MKCLNRISGVAIVFLLSAVTRLYKLSEPAHVCWDETHFGKMASWYINRRFFFDVHPPLGKMLIALAGYMTGYKGNFPFQTPGDKYNDTPYEGMRYFCAALGALAITIAYDIVFEVTKSQRASFLSAAFLIFDVGLLTLSRFILLDPIFIFFMVSSVWSMVKASALTKMGATYSLKWWCTMLFTGSMLACAVSVKFVGLFVTLFVGLYTVKELCHIHADLSKSAVETLKQILCRAIPLICWPMVMYMMFFYIHLYVLHQSGNGDGFYSSSFQSTLIGNPLYNSSFAPNVAYGSIVTIKSYKTGGGYLHSHLQLYPKGVGARQQQITSYIHKDNNNLWLIKPYDTTSYNLSTLLKNGDYLRLEHVNTGRNLHSHDLPAPISKNQMQVTGYGENGRGDMNDVWQILLIKRDSGNNVTIVNTPFILVHKLEGCVLSVTDKQLPKWGFEQQEVTCSGKRRNSRAVWNFEYNKIVLDDELVVGIHKPGFFSRFWESHSVMIKGNAALKPKEGEVISRPWEWPINYKGQFFSGGDTRIYLLGNPIIWWSNFTLLIIFIVSFVINHIRQRRRSGLLLHNVSGRVERRNISKNSEAATFFFLAWSFHYFPFWSMTRVLYFHHYFPAHMFTSMLSGVLIHNGLQFIPLSVQKFILFMITVVLFTSFKLFAPLCYGMSGPLSNASNSLMYRLKWLPTWEF